MPELKNNKKHDINITLEDFVINIQTIGINNPKVLLRAFDRNNYKDFQKEFNSLDEALAFVDNVVTRSVDIEDLIDNYIETLYEDDNKMFINETALFHILNNYYCSENDNVHVEKFMCIDSDVPRLMLYLENDEKDIIKLFYDSHLIEAINNYLINGDIEVTDITPVTGIIKSYEYDGQDKPYLEGFEVSTRKLEKDNTLSRNLNNK